MRNSEKETFPLVRFVHLNILCIMRDYEKHNADSIGIMTNMNPLGATEGKE